MVPDSIHFSVVFDLVLHDYFIGEGLVILPYGFGCFHGFIFVLFADKLLIGKVDLGHDEGIFLLPRGMSAVEEMAKSVLVCSAVLFLSFVDPPLDAEGGPL